jgi:hypothetical protein
MRPRDDRWSWAFVDGDEPGDGALWLQHPEHLSGWIDARDAESGKTYRVMVAADSFVQASLNGLSSAAPWFAVAAMIVVRADTPDVMRRCVDLAVESHAASFVGAERRPA